MKEGRHVYDVRIPNNVRYFLGNAVDLKPDFKKILMITIITIFAFVYIFTLGESLSYISNALVFQQLTLQYLHTALSTLS